MGPRPDEGLVAQVMEITQCPRKDAELALKVPRPLPTQTKDGDIERAIDYILTGDLDRDRQQQPKEKRNILRTFGSVIRAKSPLKNRRSSPSLSSTPNSSHIEIIPVSDDEDGEDEQLRVAMAMSLQQQAPPSSHSGSSRAQSPLPGGADGNPRMTSNDPARPYFGPARREDYHEGSWELVVSGPSEEQESGVVGANGTRSSNTAAWTFPSLNFEPEDLGSGPAERKRVEGLPTVLDTRGGNGTWGMDAGSSLAGLMTILHQIPKVREAFLLASPKEPVRMEEVGDRWWKGGQITSIAPSAEGEGDVTGELLLLEAAKIMAFLDDTDRSYGRYAIYLHDSEIRISQYLAAAIQNDITKVPDRDDPGGTDATPATFLHRWTTILSTSYPKTLLSAPPTNLFKTHVYQPANPSMHVTEQNEDITEITIPVPRALTDDGTASVLEAMESLFWGAAAKPACIKTLSDVLLVNLKREDREDGAGVEILSRLNIARFVWENYEQTERDIAFRRGLLDGLKKLTQREEAMTWIEREGKRAKAQDVLEATIAYVASLEGGAVVEEESDGEGNRMDIDSERRLPLITADLQASLESLQSKLNGLSSQTSPELRKLMIELHKSTETMKDQLSRLFNFSSFLTQSAADGATTRTSLVYQLRGVIVDQHLTFFSRCIHPSNPYKRKLEWFKADFSSKLELVCIDEGEVLTIARDRGSDGVLTVYVRDDVPEVVEKVMPPEYLREFIQNDNEFFERELNPPVIQVSAPDEPSTEMDTAQEEPPPPAAQSKNPFLNMAEEPESQVEPREDNMLVDPLGASKETNPFRRSVEMQAVKGQEKEDQEMGS